MNVYTLCYYEIAKDIDDDADTSKEVIGVFTNIEKARQSISLLTNDAPCEVFKAENFPSKFNRKNVIEQHKLMKYLQYKMKKLEVERWFEISEHQLNSLDNDVEWITYE